MRFTLSFLNASILNLVVVSIGSAQEALPPAGPPPPSLLGMLWQMLPMMVGVFLIFHFLVVKPQQKKLKEQQSLLASLKRGEQVVTTGGIHGRVSTLEKDSVLLEIAPNVKVKVDLQHVAKKLEVGQVEKAA